jgi:bifunctional enzyme CysN/CysC
MDAQPPLLRLIACGSADDGKSSLLDRLLHDGGAAPDDQIAALARGLQQPGDAYRYFSTARRSFIVADAPGHAHSMRTMATGAANSDLAILLVDARKGLLGQTLQHLAIAALLGIRHIALAVNKMDLVDYSEAVFDAIVADFHAQARDRNFLGLAAFPISARFGDNVVARSALMPWHGGPCLLDYLETVEVGGDCAAGPLRFSVQGANRPDPDCRGVSGTIMSGRIAVGDEIVVADSGVTAHVARIVGLEGDCDRAKADDSVTLVFADDVDAVRGDMICAIDDRPAMVEQFAAHLLWMSEDRLLPGRSYFLAMNGRTIPASITEIKHKLNVASREKVAARTLALDEIGFCNLSLSLPAAIDVFERFRATGAFLLIDRASNATVAMGAVAFPLRRAANIHLQSLSVTKEARARLKGQRPVALWFTGLSGAGKSTVANLVETRLAARGAHTITLDGDNLRHGLNRDLGFTDADRVENIRRVGEVAKLMVEAGLIVLCSFISPFAAERRMVRELLGPEEFIEIFVDTPLATCMERDRKGLYKKALAGEIRNFTGIDQPYEVPEHAEIVLKPGDGSAEQMAESVIRLLEARSILPDAAAP